MNNPNIDLNFSENTSPFFPVTTTEVLYPDVTQPTRQKIFKGKQIIVNRTTGEGLSLVSSKHCAVSHKEAYELGFRIFQELFNCDPVIHHHFLNSYKTDYYVDLINESCKIIISERGVDFNSTLGGESHTEAIVRNQISKFRLADEYYPFIRVTNSLRSNRSFTIELGYYRWRCDNGLMSGKKSNLTFKHRYYLTTFETIAVNALRHFREANRRFLMQAVELRNLISIPVPQSDMKLLVINFFKVELYRFQPEKRKAILAKLHGQCAEYAEEIGENAYALINVATDFLKILIKKDSSPSSLQAAVGEWISELQEFKPLLAQDRQKLNELEQTMSGDTKTITAEETEE